MMVNAFVTLCFDYCNNLYCGLPKREIDKLQRVQNCAACLVLGTRRSDHITPVTGFLLVHALILKYCF